ncbi:unnamed protein product, partial [Nesidiocoris tenuis]
HPLQSQSGVSSLLSDALHQQTAIFPSHQLPGFKGQKGKFSSGFAHPFGAL